MLTILADILWQMWLVLGQMAPYLLLGFLVAGVLSVFIAPQWVERWLGRPGMLPVFTASMAGVPLPLCSCGVIPVGASIRRHGASRGATAAFLISTPQTGVDSILVTYGLMGMVFAVFRPIAALVTGMVGGLLVQWTDREAAQNVSAPNESRADCRDECCAPAASLHPALRALRYGFVTLPRDIGLPLLFGAAVAGAIGALVPPGELGFLLGGGILAILLMMAASVPVYVCATATVPLAVGLIHAGASPGAALAFLIAGPATNAATIATIWKVLGRRTAAIYLATIAASAVVSGMLIDGLFPGLAETMPSVGHLHAHATIGLAGHLWAAGLLVVLAVSFFFGPRLEKDRGLEDNRGDMTEQPEQPLELAVEGMTCSHCAEAVRRALTECPGVASAQVDLAAGRAVVRGTDLDARQLADAVRSLGYQAKL